jgi:pilus assembly protein CpaB
MKMKTLVLAAVALGFGFVAMLGVRQAMNGKDEPTKTKRILVARQEIRPFTKIEPLQVAFEDYPLDRVPEGAISDVLEYEGRATKGTVAAKQAITKAMLTEKGAFGVANLIPEGMRVCTIKVNTTQAHSGLVKMSDKIDIMVTYKVAGDPRPRTKTVLEMIEVFSVDQQVAANQDEAETGTKTKIENLSVLVTPQQAQRLSQAQAKGTLEVTLRNPHDLTMSNTNMLTDEDFEALEPSVGMDRKLPPTFGPEVASTKDKPEQPEPEIEEPVAVVDALPPPPNWVITIYENDTVRNEEIQPEDAPAPTPEPAIDPVTSTPHEPSADKAGDSDRSPNGPSAKEPPAKSPSKSPKAGTAKAKTAA